MKFTAKYLGLAVITALTLAACGGGGGGSSGTSSTVTGTASKGIIVNGVVKAYKIQNGVIDTTPVAEGTTDSTGKFSLAISNYSGPLHITVGSNGTTSQMKCDAVSGCDTDGDSTPDYNFGDSMPMPTTLTMESVIPKVTSGTVQGSVTPLTHMAAALSKNNGLGELGIQTAISKVQSLLGVSNILNSKQIDLTDATAVGNAGAADVDALKTAFLAAAIAKLAQANNSGDIGAAVNTLASNFVSNGGELVQNESATTSNITLQKLTQAALDTMGDAKIATNSNNTGILAEITSTNTTATNATPDTTTTTTVAVTSSELTIAKGIVTTLRTWATTLSELETQGQLFSDEIDMAQTASTLATDTVGSGLKHATMAAGMAYWWKTFASSALVQNLAGKTVTLNDSGDTISITFGCQGDFSMVSDVTEIGQYLAVGNTVYFDKDGNNVNATFPSSSPSVGTTVNYLSESDQGGTESGSATVTNVATDETCDFTVSTALTDYIDDMNVSASGTVSISGTTVTVNGTVTETGVGTSSVNLSATMPALNGSSFTAGLSGTVSVTDKATLTIDNTSTASVTLASSFVLVDGVNTPSVPNSASFNLKGTLAQGTLDDTGSAVSDPVSFQGTIGASAVRSGGTTYDTMDLNPSSLTLSGKFSSQSGKSFEAGLSAQMTNASTFRRNQAAIGSTYSNIGSYTKTATVLTVNFPADDWSAVYTYSGGQVTESQYENGNLRWTQNHGSHASLDAFLTTFTWGWYTWVDGYGNYQVAPPQSYASSGSLSGTLIEQDSWGETASNWRKFKGALTLEAKLPALPTATATINAERTGYEAAKGDVTFAYGNITLTATASGSSEADSFSGNLLVTDTSGTSPARLTIYPDTASNTPKGSVVVNGIIVGNIVQSSSLVDTLIVNYIDGTFESVAF